MSEEQIKKAYQLAEKELMDEKEEKNKKVVKQFVQDALEKIESLDEQIDNLQKQKKDLKQALDDCKNGKLDLLKEKIEKDPEAAQTIGVRIIEVPVIINDYPPFNPWNRTWIFEYDQATWNTTSSQVSNTITGTYCLPSGHTVTLR